MNFIVTILIGCIIVGVALGFIHRVAILVLHGFVDRLTFLFRVDFTFFNVVDCVWSFPALGMVRCLTFFFVSHFIANIIIRVAFLVVTMITSLCGRKNRQNCSTPGPWFMLFLGPRKMRTNQKTHQLKQYKTRGHVGLFGVAIK